MYQTEYKSATLPDESTMSKVEQTENRSKSKSRTSTVSKTASKEAPEFTFSIASSIQGRLGKLHRIKTNLERNISRLRERLANLEEDLVKSGILDKTKLIESTVSTTMNVKQFGKFVQLVIPPRKKILPKQCTDIVKRIQELDNIVEDDKKNIASRSVSGSDVIGDAGETPQNADEACEGDEATTTTTTTTVTTATTASTTTTTATRTNNSEECTMAEYTQGHQTRFSDRIYSGFFNNKAITGASGIALSNIHNDIMYVINGHSSTFNGNIYIHVVSSTTGTYKSAVHVDGAVNHNCEDLAVAPCPSETKSSCIYIADTGHVHGGTINDIYIVAEPKDPEISTTIKYKHKINFSFSSSGIETLLVSPDSRMFVIPDTSNYTETQLLEVHMDGTIEKLCDIKFYSKHTGPVSGDIDPSGKMALVKTVDYVYFYYITGVKYDEVICDESKKVRLAYSEERHGKSIAFSPMSLSYYTCSESPYTAVWRYDRLRVS